VREWVRTTLPPSPSRLVCTSPCPSSSAPSASTSMRPRLQARAWARRVVWPSLGSNILKGNNQVFIQISDFSD
jgi:hypothetical protein